MSEQEREVGSEVDRARAEIFWRLHQGLPKQGPGSDSTTRRALSLLPSLPANPTILDLGCGPGRQTAVLAQVTGGDVIGVDLLPAFLEEAEARVREAGVADRVRFRVGSMSDLDDADATYDLIWAEGSIYIMGFSEGLRAWRRLLRPGGAIGVTELSWLVDAPPERIHRFWSRNYPGMETRSGNEARLEAAGYRLLASFVVPEPEWWDDYYTLIEERLEGIRNERSDDDWHSVVAAYDEELEVVHEGLASFGYVFYLMEPIET